MRFIRILIILSGIALVSCSDHSSDKAQGYIEGRYTYMATSVSGTLQKLLVARGNKVKQGQVLFMLEPEPESDIYNASLENLNQTIASRDAIVANLSYAKITYERYKILVPQNAIQQSQLDNAKSVYNATLAQLDQANANIAASRASLAQAQWTKEQKEMVAPVNGIVFDTYYRVGEYTEENKAILSIIAPENIKAIFYISEADLSRIQLGAPVLVYCDGCAHPYPGRVSFISPTAEYTPPVIYSTETNAKLVFRIEAAFKPQDAYHLHPGQPISVDYRSHER